MANRVTRLVMVAITAVFAFPLWLLISVGFRSPADVVASPLGAPHSLYLKNFTNAWRNGNRSSAFVNSIYITAAALIVLIVVGSGASYYFARSGKRSGGRWHWFVVAGMMVPFQIGVLPLYRVFTGLGLGSSTASVIIYNAGAQLPLTVLLYTGFIKQIPIEYEEAARIDGASSLQVFWRVVVPLLRPVTGTVIVFAGVTIWNEFFTPLLYLGGTSHVTVPVQIYSFVGEFSSDWGEIFAGLLLASLPVLVVFFVFQRYMIRSFGSGLKG